MKMLVRIFLTWSLALALVLAIIDTVKSFAAGQLQSTSIGSLWQSAHLSSFESTYAWLDAQLANFGANGMAEKLLALPGWSVFLVVGLILLMFARRSGSTVFIQTH